MSVITETFHSPHYFRSQSMIDSLDEQNFKVERNRFMTFEDWPVDFINKRELSASGFYYTKQADVVICEFCHEEFSNWTRNDNVDQEHSRNSPNCPFMNGLNCGNVPWLDEDTCGKYGAMEKQKHQVEQKSPTIKKEYIFSPKSAAQPHFSSRKNRLETFKDWPISLKQKPEELVDAGFVYTGKGDQTICHYCNIGLNNWEPEDTPWGEHEMHSPECEFLKFNKPPPPQVTQVQLHDNNNELEKSKNKNEQVALKSKEVLHDLNIEQDSKASLCKVCYTSEANVVFFPCLHLIACTNCSTEMDKCAVCRCKLDGFIRAYIS